MGLFGPPNIEKMKQKGHVIGLIKALRYERGSRSALRSRSSTGHVEGCSRCGPARWGTYG